MKILGAKNNLFKKTAASILILAHILTIGPQGEALAALSSSANYKLNLGLTNEGSDDRDSPSYIIRQDTLGQLQIGKTESANYILNTGFIYTVQSNPPVLLQLIPDYSWPQDSSLIDVLDLDNYFASPEGLALTYSVQGNEQLTVEINPITHLVSFFHPDGWYGSEDIRFAAKDTEGYIGYSNTLNLQVIGEDRDNAPVLSYIPDISVFEGELVSILAEASDVDGDAVTYSFTAPLDQSGQWQTDYGDAGEYTPTVTATDSTGLFDSQEVKITVREKNRAPILEPIDDIFANEGDLVVITPQAVDPDGNALTFYYSAPFDSQGKWLTDYDDAGTHTVKVTVSDNIDTVLQDVNVIINNTNRVPQVNLTLSDYTVQPGQAINIQLQASDPDGGALTFSLTKDGQQFDSGTIAGAYSADTSFSAIGDHTILATVQDAEGLSAQDAKGVDVADPAVNPASLSPVMGDFNGDSLLDLGLHNVDTGKWEICLSDGGVFRNAQDWLSGFGATRDCSPISGDFNGDGKTDIGIYNIKSGVLEIALSTGSAFESSSIGLTFGSASSDWQPLTGNFNADKYTDFGLYNKNSGQLQIALGDGSGFGAFSAWIDNFGQNDWLALSGDFNGDSLSDACIFKKTTGEFKVAFSNTKGFIEPAVWISGFAADKSPLISDFNNDGLTDIGFWDSANLDWRYAVSTGAAFVDKGVWLTDFGTTADESFHTGDFNGDGLVDAACFNRDAQAIECWTVRLSQGAPCDLLVEIDNGIGGKTRISYDYAAQYQNALLPFPVYVAKTISSIDTLPVEQPVETYTQEFSYSGGYYDAEEREFRGFEKIVVTDPITGNYTETHFYQGKPDDGGGALKGKIKRAIAYDGERRFISRTENVWEVRTAGASPSFLGFPYLSETVSTIWEENGTSLAAKDSFAYDNLGNVTETVNQGALNVSGDEKLAVVNYAPAYEGGFNRPQDTILKDAEESTLSRQEFSYDEKGNLKEEKAWLYNPLTLTEEFISSYYGYDDYGNITSTTNAKGAAVTTEYETTFHTFPVRVTNALGHTVEYVYEPKLGVVTQLTDANGNTTSTVYDSLGRVLQTKNTSQEVVTSYSYPDFNTKVTTQLNLTTTEYADGLGRGYKSVSCGEDGEAKRNIISEVFYNERGLKDYASLPHYEGEEPDNISYTRYEYDKRGRAVKAISDFPGTAKDVQARISYVNPLYTETIDPQGHKKGALKDVWGNTIQISEFTNAGVYTTQYKYDLKGNLLKVIDAQGNSNALTYDSLGRKLAMDDPDMGHWEYEYDAVGNLVRQIDAKGGQFIEFKYDELNRLTKKMGLSPQETVPIFSVNYHYDAYADGTTTNAIGRLSRVEDPNSTTEFFYDAEGREVKSTKTIDGTTYTVERTYDILDRLTTLKYPDGEVVAYTYDTNSGLLESVEGNSVYAQDITYNAQGQMFNVQYGNGTQTSYAYGQDLRLSQILTNGADGRRLQDLLYTFDLNGNLTCLYDNLTRNNRQFAYDDLDRLVSALNIPSDTHQWGVEDSFYRYDSIGNMTYKSDVGLMEYGEGPNPQGGNFRPHAVTSLIGPAGTVSISYDENGNMTQKGASTFTYDIENRLTQVTSSSSTTQFFYDGDGGRLKKLTVDTGEFTVYIGSIYEVDSEGIATKHIFAGSNRICSLKSNGTSLYYHQDHLGSSNVISDGSGSKLAQYEYSPYGSFSKTEPADPETRQLANHYFTGKELDNSTGLYFYGARYYDPTLGRFIQADTCVPNPANPQDFNRYTYCRNNPLIYTDPSGNFPWVAAIIGAILGAISGGVAAHQAGGNVFAGIAVGAFIGFMTGTAAVGAAASMNSLALASGGIITAAENALITGVEFAIGGFGAGLASGFAGGEGSASGMLKSAGIGAGIGFVTGAAIGYSYQAGWQGLLHGNDSKAINELYSQAQEALASGNLQAYAEAAIELQTMGISPPKTNSVLGIYRESSTIGLYADDLLIYSETEWHFEGGPAGIFGGQEMLAGKVYTTGEFAGGSSRILVYGMQETMKPTSWQVHIYGEIGGVASTAWTQYGWKTVTEDVALRLSVTKKAETYFRHILNK